MVLCLTNFFKDFLKNELSVPQVWGYGGMNIVILCLIVPLRRQVGAFGGVGKIPEVRPSCLTLYFGLRSLSLISHLNTNHNFFHH